MGVLQYADGSRVVWFDWVSGYSCAAQKHHTLLFKDRVLVSCGWVIVGRLVWVGGSWLDWVRSGQGMAGCWCFFVERLNGVSLVCWIAALFC